MICADMDSSGRRCGQREPLQATQTGLHAGLLLAEAASAKEAILQVICLYELAGPTSPSRRPAPEAYRRHQATWSAPKQWDLAVRCRQPRPRTARRGRFRLLFRRSLSRHRSGTNGIGSTAGPAGQDWRRRRAQAAERTAPLVHERSSPLARSRPRAVPSRPCRPRIPGPAAVAPSGSSRHEGRSATRADLAISRPGAGRERGVVGRWQ